MKSDRIAMAAVAMLAVVGAFYLLVLSPKREEASKLEEDVAQLRQTIDQEKQVVAFAEEARKEFPTYYGRLVVLGKAAPEQGDSASLIVQVNRISRKAKVDFQQIKLGQATSTGPTPTPALTQGDNSSTPSSGAPASGSTPPAAGTTPPPAAGTTPPAGGTAPAPGSTPASTTATPAPATEASAATLPIGATVGPAGLPVIPYELLFRGRFFQVADFIEGIDELVHIRDPKQKIVADGRLLTIDGFALGGDQKAGFPTLTANFSVTSYSTPPDQGLMAGATPTGPAAAATAQPGTVPASTGVAVP